jgi:2',3'-cyclic-nucleotide 2'-phosphodiesterase / 3'-nucleotidase
MEKGGGLMVQLRLLETTDLHVHLANYDYYQTKENHTVGLVKTATLIQQARSQVKNSLLFDNGDFIQGNPLGDYLARVRGINEGDIHPVIRAFHTLQYDAITIGNHEFNYGLDFLTKVLSQAEMPIVNANIYDAKTEKPYFEPYVILNKKVLDENGQIDTLKVGVIGFVPPQIMEWDKGTLEGKVIVHSIVETAKKYIPEMKNKGADVIVALAHTGISADPYIRNMENAAYYLSQVEGIDAVLAGHSHHLFPGPECKDVPHIDLEKGTIHGKPVVMAGSFGSHLGVIDLTLQKKNNKWEIVDSLSLVRPIADAHGHSLIEANEAVMADILPEHQATIEYVNRPIGETTAPIFSYFALVQDDSAVQIVNDAQTEYLSEKLKDFSFHPFAGIPILSAAAPFKAGGRGGPDFYTDIPAGTLAIKNIADLYLYPNTLQAVLVNGRQLKEWLEMSAGQFNRIDPGKSGEQPLINPYFPSFNFDIIDGVEYQIDVTQPAKYDVNGCLENPDSNRIVNLKYRGNPVRDDQMYIVATHNYRASSTTYPGVREGKVIFTSPDENRQILTDYIRKNKIINPTADGNWSIAPFHGVAKPIFYTSPRAKTYAAQYKNIQYIGAEKNFAKYMIHIGFS